MAKKISAKSMIGWIMVWQTQCAGGVTYDNFLCKKRNARCDKKDKKMCQSAMKRIMERLKCEIERKEKGGQKG